MAITLNRSIETKLFPFFGLLLSLAALLFWAQPAHASRLINSVTLNGGASVTVAPTTSIAVTMNVTTDNGGGNPRWRSSALGFIINGAPVAGACVNHPNHDKPGTYTETFNITAPTLAGTYDALFTAFNDNNCAGAASPIYTLTNGVIVTSPVVTSIVLNNPNPTALASVSWTVTFNRAVTLVDAGDFSLVAGGGVSGASITAVSGSGTTWTVTANTGSGDGSLGLNLVDNDTIIDAWNNRLGGTGMGNGSFTGPVYTITKVSQFDAVEIGALRATPISTKIAGANFSLDVLALNAANAISTGYTGTVTVALVDGSAGACAGLTTIQTAFSVTFAAADNGRKTVTFNFNNSSPNVRVRVISASPPITSCSSDNFAIRPENFSSVSATDSNALTAGTTRTLSSSTFAVGTPFHRAGRPITLRAMAVTATAVGASNYAGSPAVAVLSSCGAAAACPSTVGTLATGSWGVVAPAGSVISNTASYDEVGAFNMALQDQTFANVDAADTPATCSNVATIGRYICQTTPVTVGRFVPDHFTVAYNTPTLRTACGAFTYVGQPFNYVTAPVITVTARNFAGGTTVQYSGVSGVNLWRLTNATLTYPAGNRGYAAAVGTVDPGLVPVVDPVILETSGGIGTLSFSSGTGLGFTRVAPVAPFDADISLGINIIDADGITYASNPASFGAASAGNGMAFDNGKPMRYGRLKLSNAYGSELLDLPIPMETQFWTGTAFVTNTMDSCTVINTNNIALGSYKNGITSTNMGAPGHIIVGGAFSAGRGSLRLTKPSPAGSGSVDIAINLGTASPDQSCLTWSPSAPASTAGNKSYLRGRWCGLSDNRDPSARAAFGIYKNANQFIYMREMY